MKYELDADNHMMVCADKAPEGYLKWLMVDEGTDPEEVIPVESGMYYELTYDEEGRVYPTMVVRGDDGSALAGVQLSYVELMGFSRWAFQNGLCLMNLKASTIKDFTKSDAASHTFMRHYVADMLDFIQEQQPEPFADLIKDTQKEVVAQAVEKAVKRAERDAEARARAEAAVELKALELRHAKHIVQLSKAATLSDAERNSALDDPILQSVILKAVQQVADCKRTA